jgi:hypothetical protein
MSAALTQWFPADVKPVRDGVYETRLVAEEDVYQRWYQGRWCSPSLSKRRAFSTYYPALIQNLQWRGLASDPSVTP